MTLHAGRIAAFLTLFAAAARGDLVARWTLDGTAPYADSGPNNIPLDQDTATTPAATGVPAVRGNGVRFQYQDPGPSTRLFANSSALQTDSFGFAFWFDPVAVNPFDKLLTKERAYTTQGQDFEKLSWQLQATGDAGNGKTALELVVRGSNGGFFGNVMTAATIPLGYDEPSVFHHVAGGYDATTGELAVYLDGVRMTSTNSSPGANNHDGSPLSFGTYRNGTDFKGFAAGFVLDDAFVFDALPTQTQVDAIMAGTYTPAPEPTTAVLSLMAGAGVLTRRRV